MVLKEFLFLDETSSAISNVFAILNQGSSLNIQVSGASSINIVVEGQLDNQSNSWATIAAVNLADLSTTSNITSTGIYSIAVDGLKYVRIKNNGAAGTVRVYGALTE